ncbi:acyl-CoA dehydrogenase family protein [Natronoglycomyces albus]|uniref:Acyl-CoA dehydrogenase family protein n=1 Tax=Natronoglycomyces albus TaxID=2811108 RepID=A0A895XSG9_9ACTN|nr:acyl-CoA dehydrogenase family protein [Natronoglycomyces albus]QSB05496.1 acyl-CoA dehydrogenase family protein [Natronoglycomyces albus]
MDFRLTPDQRDFAAAVRDFVNKEVRPVSEQNYENHTFPTDLVRKLGELGVFGVTLPEEYGGAGGDMMLLGLAIEEIAKVDSSLAVTVEAGVTLGAEGIYHFGTDDQRKKWLPRIATQPGLVAFGLTEPEGGSDAGATKTRARVENGEWVIDGAKCFITNSGTDLTELIIVTAVTGERPDGRPEISAIVVPKGTPGLTVGKPYSKVGWNSSDTRPLFFDNCRVPEENLLGPRGKGFAQFLQLLDNGRIMLAALSAGMAQGCVDEALAYAKTRKAFGRYIGENQAIQFQLADMKLRAYTARLAWRDAAERAIAGKPYKDEAAMCKLHASDAAVENARAATQIFGGYGFMNETLVARHWRDSKILEIGEGTNEVQRMLIARGMGLK